MRPAKPLIATLALALLVGCPPPSEGEPCFDFAVGSTSVDVGPVGIDQTREATLSVSSTCDEPVTVQAEISGEGFTVTPGTVMVAAAYGGELSIAYTASAEGSASGSLTVWVADETPVTVALTAQGVPWRDDDGDGYAAIEIGGDDCNDDDATIHPGAEETWYDGVDQDCDGGSDFDQDGDGSDIPADCDDTDPDVRPGVEDVENGEDDDCDGLVDEGSYGADDILITEVMHSPLAVSDDVGEWIELYNRGDSDLQLRGLRVADGNGEGGFTIDRPVLVPAGGYAVLGADGRASNNGGAVVDFVYNRDTLKLNVPDGGVSLLGAGDLVISRVVWSAGWPYTEGASMQLDPAADSQADLATRGLWCDGKSVMAAGDLGTPKAANDACPRFDADSDGYAVQDGDCDDDDPDVNPGETEVWGDGIDNDCSGLADEGTLASLRSARLTGSDKPTKDSLGYHDDFSVGDVDGDGDPDVMFGTRFGSEYAGTVYILDASAVRTGAVASQAKATFSGGSVTNQLGLLGTFAGDVTGDGVDDLVIGGSDARNADDFAAVVLAGGSSLRGDLGPDDAVLSFTGVVARSGGDVHGGLDLNGDGRAELIHGDIGHDDRAGRIAVVLGGTTGTVDAPDADRAWTGSVRQDHAGASLGGADLDGDGYDDLLAAAWGDDTEATNGGALHLIFGGSTLASDGTAGSRARARLLGDLDGMRLGEGAAARVADFDDDGNLDLLIGAPVMDRAFIWLDAGSLSGSNLAANADHVLTGPGAPDSFGMGLAAADVDGDGIPEAIVGAPDDMTAVTSLSTDPGEVWIYDLDGAPRALPTGAARAVIRGADAGDAVGQTLLGFDLDGDGVDDLLIGATGDASGAGAVHRIDF